MPGFSLTPRVAAEQPTAVYALKAIGYTALLWLVFLLSIPCAIVSVCSRLGMQWSLFEPGRLRDIAVVLFWIAASIGFWSGYVLVARGGGTPMPLECTRRLVIAGPYRIIRNPMSAMAILQGLCVGVVRGSWLVLAYALCGALFWNLFLRPWEERDLSGRFGAAYEHYRANVRCWVPRMRPYSPVASPPPR